MILMVDGNTWNLLGCQESVQKDWCNRCFIKDCEARKQYLQMRNKWGDYGDPDYDKPKAKYDLDIGGG